MAFCRACGNHIGESAFCGACGLAAGAAVAAVARPPRLPGSPPPLPPELTGSTPPPFTAQGLPDAAPTREEHPSSRDAAAIDGARTFEDKTVLGRAVGQAYRWAQLLLVSLGVFAALCVWLKSPWLSFLQAGGVRLAALTVGFTLVAPLWLLWQRSAYRALRVMGSGQRSWSGVVGCWLVPVRNLIRPYQLTRDLWIRSATGNPAPLAAAPLTAPLLVTAWWAACLCTLLGLGYEWASDWLVALILRLMFVWMPLIASVLAALVVVRIQDFQLARADRPERLARMSGGILKLAAAGAALGAIAWVGLAIQSAWSTSSPEGSIQALADAYNHHDVENFRRYCDTVAVLDREYLRIKNDPRVSGFDSTANLGAFFVGAMGSYMGAKHEATHEDFARRMEESYVGGQGMPNMPPGLFDLGGLVPGGAGPIGRIGVQLDRAAKAQAEDMRAGFNSEYRGVARVTRDGGDALVQLRYDRPSDGKILHLLYTIRMKRSGLHWRVSGIEDAKIN